MDEKLIQIHNDAIEQFSYIQHVMRDERMQCLQDRRFASIAGAQWEGALGEQFENKPRLEMNKVHLAVTRIQNEYLNNRITVNFVSKEGDEYDSLAETCSGLYRADELDSQAEEAYDNAFKEGVEGGFGAWRLRNEYEDESDEDNEYQRIRIEPIYDADSSVYFDLDAKRQDKSDAKYCYVISSMTPEKYKELYGEDATSVQKIVKQNWFDWYTPNVVYVAEYYLIEEKPTIIVTYKDSMGEVEKLYEDQLTEDKAKELKSRGFQVERTRKVKRKKVHKYIISGSRVLEDCGYIAGTEIPIVPYYGKRWYIDNVERCMGHVRMVKDAQRVKNMQLSKLAEISSLSSHGKPIMTPDQVAGFETLWARDNVDNNPFLLVNPIMDANGNISAQPPVGYTQPPTIPPALGALLQYSDQDMNDLLGNQQAGEQIVSNISGKAVEMIQSRLDMQAYIYISNMAKAIKRSGQIWLSMARDIFVEEGRRMKTVNDQDESDFINLMQPSIGKNGEMTIENNLADAKFDISVDVGATASSRRQTTVKTLTALLPMIQDPNESTILQALILQNTEGEGFQDVRDYYRRKLVQLGVYKPTKEEAQAMAQAAQNQQPDPQSQYLEAAAQEAQAKAMKAQADTQKVMADAEKVKADTIKTMTELSREGRTHVIETAQKLRNMQNPAFAPNLENS